MEQYALGGWVSWNWLVYSCVATAGQKDLPHVASEDVDESKGCWLVRMSNMSRKVVEDAEKSIVSGFEGLFFGTRVSLSGMKDP